MFVLSGFSTDITLNVTYINKIQGRTISFSYTTRKKEN